MSDFFVRLKTKEHNLTLSESITSESSFYDLKRIICNKFGFSNVKILVGFPPKIITFSDTTTLKECGIQKGDTLHVEPCQDHNEFIPDIININDAHPDVTNIRDIPDIMKTDRCEDNRNENREQTTHLGANTNDSIKTGIIMRKEVPSDNSCLFTSVEYLLSGKIDQTTAPFLRQLIIESIRNNSEEYNEAVLGKSIDNYCEWISLPTTWGGGIEIAILSDHFGVELVVANTKTGTLSKFGEDKCYAHRGFLIFDGIHYDPLYMELLKDGTIETLFPSDNTEVLVEVQQLIDEAKTSKQYVEVNELNLICAECGHRMTGCNDALQHMHYTGHKKFDEIFDNLLDNNS